MQRKNRKSLRTSRKAQRKSYKANRKSRKSTRKSQRKTRRQNGAGMMNSITKHIGNKVMGAVQNRMNNGSMGQYAQNARQMTQNFMRPQAQQQPQIVGGFMAPYPGEQSYTSLPANMYGSAHVAGTFAKFSEIAGMQDGGRRRKSRKNRRNRKYRGGMAPMSESTMLLKDYTAAQLHPEWANSGL